MEILWESSNRAWAVECTKLSMIKIIEFKFIWNFHQVKTELLSINTIKPLIQSKTKFLAVVSNLYGRLKNSDEIGASCICKRPAQLFLWLVISAILSFIFFLPYCYDRIKPYSNVWNQFKVVTPKLSFLLSDPNTKLN